MTPASYSQLIIDLPALLPDNEFRRKLNRRETCIEQRLFSRSQAIARDSDLPEIVSNQTRLEASYQACRMLCQVVVPGRPSILCCQRCNRIEKNYQSKAA